jgi:hypothetical protein
MRETEKELEEEGDVSLMVSVLRVTVPEESVNKGDALLDASVVLCCKWRM